MGKIWDMITAGTKHKGQHAAGGQRGKHAGTGAVQPAKTAKQQKRAKKK